MSRSQGLDAITVHDEAETGFKDMPPHGTLFLLLLLQNPPGKRCCGLQLGFLSSPLRRGDSDLRRRRGLVQRRHAFSSRAASLPFPC
jgi:hypothetical protein